MGKRENNRAKEILALFKELTIADMKRVISNAQLILSDREDMGKRYEEVKLKG